MQALQATKDAVKTELQALSKDLKRAQRAERDAARAAARKWSLTGGILHTVLIIYALCDSSVAPASKYLRVKARGCKWPPKDDDELEQLVLGAFADASIPLLVGLTDEAEPTDEASMCTAQIYCLEWRLVCWASHINATTGEAPDSNMVRARWDVIRKQLPEAIRPPPRSREWVRRWLERWGGSFGLAPVGDEPPLATKLAKVHVFPILVPPRPSEPNPEENGAHAEKFFPTRQPVLVAPSVRQTASFLDRLWWPLWPPGGPERSRHSGGSRPPLLRAGAAWRPRTQGRQAAPNRCRLAA